MPIVTLVCVGAAIVNLICGIVRPNDALVYFVISALFSAMGIVGLWLMVGKE